MTISYTLLALESSCDETAASILRFEDGSATILAENLHSQIAEHTQFGGVVPEVAARSHMNTFPDLIEKTLHEADTSPDKLHAIVCTTGPGLIGGLLVGSMIAQSMALRWSKPFYGIHHLEGHLLSPRLHDARPDFPYLVLLASGGHTLIVLAKAIGDYQILGRSRDDALGEAFDKSAIIMSLPYPGGPVLEQLAHNGNAQRFSLPSPLVGGRDKQDRESCGFSFSGLKTAVARLWKALPAMNDTEKQQAQCDMAASFHQAVSKVLCNRLRNAMVYFRHAYPEKSQGTIPVVFVGGVAANNILRNDLNAHCIAEGASLSTVPLALCTDNATMIAWAALERIHNSIAPNIEHNRTRPRWNLEEL